MTTSDKKPKARMRHPARILGEVEPAVTALAACTRGRGVSDELLALIHLRASQVNGCSPCVDGAAHGAKQAGASAERLFAVAAWREAPYFSEAERTALALAEAVTRLSDRPDPVPDAVWDEAAGHYDESALAAILVTIASANLLNRLNLPTRQIAGEWDR